MSDEPTTEIVTGLSVRLRFTATGGRDETHLAAIDHYDRTLEDGWRLVYVEQDLVLEDLDSNGVPHGETWQVEYDAMGVLRRG